MQNYTITKITDLLSEDDVDRELINELKKDSRIGVIKLLEKWERKKEAIKKQKEKLVEMSRYEKELYKQGFKNLAGVDEVGRGPLAGPVVAAAVVLPDDFYILGINDSKQLSEGKREELFELIHQHAISIGIGIIPPQQIDEVNIYQATKLAMRKAISQLAVTPDYLLIDAMKLEIDIPQLSLVKGDEKSISIAASSIIAKVIRDRYMKRLGQDYPQFGFESHMGYGTKQHLEAITTYGVTPEHRLSFAPIKDGLK
ncbi:ribonuclease HII [Bacillus suaedaesalsae]|uniref:Ribonuclease HII n=1 Tax=Bacillus suaedaesalsae TaxID=2810349 RepID=A0ABS2DLV1_9BACI|nr:ribonuclease HII [Bacillus suaedaesalsae]MBM6618463.1 ribonuclease HII [Bacillus suaedaesalsae]